MRDTAPSRPFPPPFGCPALEAEAKRLAWIFRAHDADEDLIWLTLEDHEDVDAGTFTHAQLFNRVMANL